ncbi:hypothetical protein [Brunnivagina elsteri]|nr:hypothetical protein [Calothrix elsteri]
MQLYYGRKFPIAIAVERQIFATILIVSTFILASMIVVGIPKSLP